MEQHIHQILVGFDLSEGSVAAMKAAIDLAKRTQGDESTIRVVTAIPRLKRSGGYPDLASVDEAVRGKVQQLEPGEIPIEYDVGWTDLVRHMTEAAHMSKADLIVVGSRGDAAKKVGTETVRLVRRSAWPVLVVKPENNWPPKKILCAIDFSQASERAFGWTRDFARLSGASVHLLHVLEQGAMSRQLASVVQSRPPADDDTEARSVSFEALVDRHGAGDLKITHDVVLGRPHEKIIQAAEGGGFDLLCIGSLGRNPLVDMMIGGTTERVLKTLPCSLFAVKPDAVAIKFKATL